MTAPRHRQTGWSLVELAVSLVIAALLTALLFTLLPLGRQVASGDRQQRQLAQAEEALLGYGLSHYHLPFADADGEPGVAAQLQRFEAATRDLPGERSLSNSAALLRHADAAAVRGDWVRAGIMLYGSAPDFPRHTAAQWELQPTQSLRSRLLAVQQLAPGESVGYGSSFRADAAMRIGVVACGYADGYPRHAPSGTPVLVDGVRTRLVGRVSMDMLTVALDAVPAATSGSEVTLWGRGPHGSVLAVDEVAQAAGTIGYELMCAVAPRVRFTVEAAAPEA